MKLSYFCDLASDNNRQMVYFSYHPPFHFNQVLLSLLVSRLETIHLKIEIPSPDYLGLASSVQ